MSDLPRLHTPKEIADSLGVSEWLVKDRARRREIPSVLVGRAYRFTEQHWTEIVAHFEQRPGPAHEATAAAPRRRRTQPQPPRDNSVIPLQVRPPRRRPQAG